MAESEKRLQFLLSLMELRGVSKHELARMMGVSPQNIFTYFKRDDMKLSYAQEMASRLGYDLSYRLEKEGTESRDVVLDIEGLVGKDGLQRLLAEQLELNYTGVNRWFKVDDIAISYLYKIAELYGLKVKIKAVIQKKDSGVMELS